MRKFIGCAFALACAVGLSAGEAQAQIDVSGSVDFYYSYYLNKTEPQLMRTFDLAHNSFTLGLAEVVLQKAPTAASRVGGRVDLDFGTSADLVAAFEPDPAYGSDGPEIFRNLQQAYISVMASDQVTVDFGKFVTPLGAEVIESQNNMNYSRSVLFGFAIPFYHAGARVTMAASDQLTLAGYIVNGWNNVSDNNRDKTFIASATFVPSSQLTWYGNLIAGKEADFDGNLEQDMLWVFDTTLSFAATEMITLMANFDYGSATDADPVTANDPATFWGIAAYARLQAQEDWALAGRVEYLDDSSDGFIAIGEKAQTFTVTSDHSIFGDLMARIEVRVDKTESDQFIDVDGDPKGTQPSLTVGLVYEFN